MNQRYSVVRYVDKMKKSGNVKIPTYKSKRVVTSKTVRYHNCQHKLAPLNKCAGMLLLFICENMDEDNNIDHTSGLRRKFRYHLNKNCSVTYSDDTVKKAFYQLVEQDLIISFGVKTEYVVNPLYHFNDTEKKRISLIQKLIYWAKTNPAPKKSNILRAFGV